VRSAAAARRYARALFALAGEEDRVEPVRASLAELDDLLRDHRELRNLLLTPLHPVAERRAVLRALVEKLQAGPILGQFCAYLIDRRRLIEFKMIREEYDRLADEATGHVTAEVLAASELSPGQREQLQRALSTRTGRTVQLDVNVRPDLIGGAIAKVGDLVFDGSLRTQLAQLRANLTREA